MPTWPAPVVAVTAEFVAEVGPVMAPLAVYAGGSLASGDYVARVSDLDLVAVVPSRLDQWQLRTSIRMHRRMRQQHAAAAKLHCLYVAVNELDRLSIDHLMWVGRRMSRRTFSGVARAELMRGGVVLHGPPATAVPGFDSDAPRRAVLHELNGYWTAAAGWRWAWWLDLCVDLGLLTLSRAQAALTTGDLITKQQAIERLLDFDVPAALIDQMRRRARRAAHRHHPRPASPRARTALPGFYGI